jgi:hypothetical protein
MSCTAWCRIPIAAAGAALLLSAWGQAQAQSVADNQTGTATQVTISSDKNNPTLDPGFNVQPTPLPLRTFTATRADEGVFVRWQNSGESKNVGFNIYRSTSADGLKTRLNRDLLPALGNVEDGKHQLIDATADMATTYWYWLEDVIWQNQARLYGPAVVSDESNPLRNGTVLGTFGVTGTGASQVYRIRYTTLAAAGVPVDKVNAKNLQVWVNGAQVAAFASAWNGPMKKDDFFLFYMAAATKTAECEIRVGQNALRMEEVYAAPTDGAGKVWYSEARDGRIEFGAATNILRYLLTGFAKDDQVWLFDVTDAAAVKFLYDFARVNTGTESGLYLSHPAPDPAKYLAIGSSAVQDVPKVSLPPEEHHASRGVIGQIRAGPDGDSDG